MLDPPTVEMSNSDCAVVMPSTFGVAFIERSHSLLDLERHLDSGRQGAQGGHTWAGVTYRSKLEFIPSQRDVNGQNTARSDAKLVFQVGWLGMTVKPSMRRVNVGLLSSSSPLTWICVLGLFRLRPSSSMHALQMS